MSIIQGNAHTSAGGGGYQIERSLRFNFADSAYLNRTPGSASNRKTWTWSGWVKKSALGSNYPLFAASASSDDNGYFNITFNSSEQILIQGWSTNWRATTRVFRDPSAWYHIVCTVDTTQATANNRIRLYINGVEETSFGTLNNPSQNADLGINTAASHRIGNNLGSSYFNGYMTEVNLIDGQALTPSSFGFNSSDTGVWSPKQYIGSYGTNGFYVNFSDNSNTTAATLGKDSSGNGNNWTPNNFSVTAGAGNDSMVDSPTLYGTDTGAGGEVRGNYATLNALWKNSAWSPTNGNLTANIGSGTNGYVALGSFAMPAGDGKWYFEVVFTSGSPSGANQQIGIVPISGSYAATQVSNTDISNTYSTTNGYAYNAGGTKNSPAGRNATYTGAASWGVNDVVGVAFDAGAGTLTFYKNGASQGQAFSGITTSEGFYPAIADYAGLTVHINCGQRPWYSTAPSGFKALCTTNLPTPTIGATSTTQANDYFNAVLYTGNGSTQSITGVGFQPDWVWLKSRSNATDNELTDAVRGATKSLISNSTAAEATDTNGLTAFNSDGFSLGTDANYNGSTRTYVAWNWNAGGSNATNTSGTITSTVRANTTSGFSIVTYTGTGSNATVGHGLGVAPSMVIVKNRDVAARQWAVYHNDIGNGHALLLDSTAAKDPSALYWNSTSTTSTVFSVGTGGYTNESTRKTVAYCFAPVAGYSAFGSYTGNGSADGAFVYLGFRPRWVMIKRSDSTGNWIMIDNSRSTFNAVDINLFADLSNAESNPAGAPIDVLSNGFKMRTSGAGYNASGGTYIYMAFAEFPTKFSLAR